MSFEYHIFLRRGAIPSPRTWRDSIRAAGFELDIDADFDMEEFVGFLPCLYAGEKTGFEFFSEEINDEGLSEEIHHAISNRQFLITLVTHSDYRECIAATIAAAVLCLITHGVVMEDGEPPFIGQGNAIAWAKKRELELLEEISAKGIRPSSGVEETEVTEVSAKQPCVMITIGGNKDAPIRLR